MRNVQDFNVEVECLPAGQRMVEIQDNRIVFHLRNPRKDFRPSAVLPSNCVPTF